MEFRGAAVQAGATHNRTIGAKYGAATVEHMAAALEKFPQYDA